MKDEQIEKDLKDLVKACKENMPKLKEIRVFGSYNNGNWDQEKSDVDIFILINCLNASEYNLSKVCDFQVRKARFEFHVFTPYSLYSVMNMGRGDIHENARNGRLIYRKSILNLIRG